MNRLLLSATLLITVLIVSSWGTTGHFASGLIAEHHLTPVAAQAVKDLLGTETLADVSTWADDVRSENEYAGTDKWHYINLPKGIASYAAFAARVAEQKEENVYKAVLQCRETLLSPTADRKKKTEALRFLIHFVGDLHQPMHVSRAEDRGGNSITVQYRNQRSNLHAVWDGKLIADGGKGYRKIASHYDTASAQQVARWQQDSLLQWIWESYQISETLYAETEQPSGRIMKRPYYTKHIATVYERIEKGGVRLAGMLNKIFDSSYKAPANTLADKSAGNIIPAKYIDIKEARNHIGEYVTICARVCGSRNMDDLKLVNLGKAYPNQLMTIVLKGRALTTWKRLYGRKIAVTGKLIMYKGIPEIVVTNPHMIRPARKMEQ